MAALNDILAGRYDDDRVEAMNLLEKALDEAEVMDRGQEYADLLDQVSKYIPDLVAKEAQ